MAAIGLALPGEVRALTPTATIGLRATVVPACAAGTLDYGVLDFGTHGALSSQVEARSSAGAGTIQVTCTSGLSYSVSLDSGLYATGTQRRMRSAAGALIRYQLFSDSQFSTSWDEGVTVDLVGTGQAQEVPLYGRVAAQPTPAAGTYNDTVRVTVNW